MSSTRRTDWPTLALLGVMYAVLLGNAALYYEARQPLVVHVLLGALGIHMAFTIWHEAAHGTVSRHAWVNDVVGVVGMLPYMTPYFMQRWVHLEHHAQLNKKEDPNFIYTDGPFLGIFFRYPRALRYAKELLTEDPRTRAQRASDLFFLMVVGSVYAFAAVEGAIVDVLVLWFAPVVVAKIVMDWYVNYLPHVGLPADRFRGTRILDVGWFTPLVLGHNYHAIHHLWPPVPWHQYRAVFLRKNEYLRENHVPVERRVFANFRREAELARQGSEVTDAAE
jgi:beta-carotene hydroxylase